MSIVKQLMTLLRTCCLTSSLAPRSIGPPLQVIVTRRALYGVCDHENFMSFKITWFFNDVPGILGDLLVLLDVVFLDSAFHVFLFGDSKMCFISDFILRTCSFFFCRLIWFSLHLPALGFLLLFQKSCMGVQRWSRIVQNSRLRILSCGISQLLPMLQVATETSQSCRLMKMFNPRSSAASRSNVYIASRSVFFERLWCTIRSSFMRNL